MSNRVMRVSGGVEPDSSKQEGGLGVEEEASCV